MAVIRKIFGASRPEREPHPDWDVELSAMRGIGEWLATIPTEEGRLRALSYFMWRLKSGDDPRVESWVESIAEQSTMMVSKKHGFSEGVE